MVGEWEKEREGSFLEAEGTGTSRGGVLCCAGTQAGDQEQRFELLLKVMRKPSHSKSVCWMFVR